MSKSCACVCKSAVGCWAIRYKIPDWAVQADGGPCVCNCHDGCDEEDDCDERKDPMTDDPANTPIIHHQTGPTCSLMQTSERAASWLHIFHRLDGIPVTSCYAEEENGVRVHMLDLTRITGAERARLIAYYVQRLNMPAHKVDEELDILGCPIRAEDVTVSIPMHMLT